MGHGSGRRGLGLLSGRRGLGLGRRGRRGFQELIEADGLEFREPIEDAGVVLRFRV
jgi:hypothetical protein